MKDPFAAQGDRLEQDLQLIGQALDIPKILNATGSNSEITAYYRTADLAYRIVNGWAGFLHCGISFDGTHKADDLVEQARMVEWHVRCTDARRVLELGCGLGANSGFLARRNPYVIFEGLDLSRRPLARYTRLRNFRFRFGDYHDLGALDDEAYDLVFAIETLDYSRDKPRIFAEVKKKLRRGGLFIVIDAYARDRATPLSDAEKVMWGLVARGFALDKFETVGEVEAHMQEGFSVLLALDLTPNVLPFVERRESLMRKLFARPALARLLARALPFDIAKTGAGLFLIAESVRRQVGCYYLHVLRNS